MVRLFKRKRNLNEVLNFVSSNTSFKDTETREYYNILSRMTDKSIQSDYIKTNIKQCINNAD